jgi:SEC-C motif-containing protein
MCQHFPGQIPGDRLCRCGSNLQYDFCCRTFHEKIKTPITAESLMRSRFTAYAMQNEAYLLETWEAGKRPEAINFSKEVSEWTKLEILKTKKGKEKDIKGIVEFKAYYTQDGEGYVMNEISRFTKASGRWVYLDGLVKSVKKVTEQAGQSKNAPCSCGSGKKFKRCCGK